MVQRVFPKSAKQCQFVVFFLAPFPQVDAGFPCPPEEVRKKIMGAVKNFFAEEDLQPEYAPWRDLAGTLYFAVENILEQEKVMIKLKNIEEERGKGKFNFSVFVIKRPDLYPNWTDPFYADWSEPDSDNDYEDGPEEQIFYCTLVTVNIIKIDSLKKMSALVVSKMNSPEALIIDGEQMPTRLLSIVQDLMDKDLDE